MARNVNSSLSRQEVLKRNFSYKDYNTMKNQTRDSIMNRAGDDWADHGSNSGKLGRTEIRSGLQN
jgi:hypothetical protein